MTSKETLLHLSPRGVERAEACFIAETSAAPGQLYRAQDYRNEGTKNGFLCLTISVALSGEGTI